MKIEYFIFALLFIIGTFVSLIIIINSTNLIYKSSDFSRYVDFKNSDVPGDNGYLVIERHDSSPSIADFVTFENGKNHIFFGSNLKIKKKLNFNITELDSGVYYVNIVAMYSSGKKETKEIKFKIY